MTPPLPKSNALRTASTALRNSSGEPGLCSRGGPSRPKTSRGPENAWPAARGPSGATAQWMASMPTLTRSPKMSRCAIGVEEHELVVGVQESCNIRDTRGGRFHATFPGRSADRRPCPNRRGTSAVDVRLRPQLDLLAGEIVEHGQQTADILRAAGKIHRAASLPRSCRRRSNGRTSDQPARSGGRLTTLIHLGKPRSFQQVHGRLVQGDLAGLRQGRELQFRRAPLATCQTQPQASV